MSYDTVVFDNDGVLVGRTRFDVLREATAATFEEFGVNDPDPGHVEEMTVGATPRRVTTVSGEYGLDPGRFWRTRDGTVSRAQQEEARAGRKTPYDDVDALADLDVSMGVVSSNQQETVDFVLDHFGLSGLFGATYGRSATIESLSLRKPDPHYLERALAELRADAESALYVGDNESDVRAAHNAGMDSAFVRRPHRDDWELDVWPTWEIGSLEELHEVCSG